MTDSPFHGVIPPVVIPLTEKKQLDLEAFERSINRMIDAGVDGLFFLGSSGEVAFLTDAQRYHVLQEAVAIVNHRVPVLAGVIDMETLRVVDQAKRAKGFGVDALVATAPFYALDVYKRQVDKVSASAKAKIEAAGGKVEEPC